MKLSKISRAAMFVFVLLHATATLAQCGGINDRQIGISNHYLETGDTLNGLLATVSICGGCTVLTNDPEHYPYELQIRWGDGTTTALRQGQSGDAAWDPAKGPEITGRHTYTRAIDPPRAFIVAAQAWCWDTNVQPWRELVVSNCEQAQQAFFGKRCIASDRVVGVYDPLPPKAVLISGAIFHRTLNKRALTVIIEAAAPKSGMKFDVTSSDPRVNVVGPVIIPEGKSAWDFDVDASAVPIPLLNPVTFSVSSGGVTKSVDASIH